MILRFFSGSVTPFNFFKNTLPARANRKLIFKCFLNIFITCSASPSLNTPLSTHTQVNCLPMALYSKTAATEESTPPERPKITFSAPTCCRISSMAWLTKAFIEQDFLQRQILKRKLASIFLPDCVWRSEEHTSELQS